LSKIEKYIKDDLEKHSEDIRSTMKMVGDNEIDKSAAMKWLGKFLTRHHATLTQLCKELKILTENDEAEQILSSVAKLQNQLKVEISSEQI
jgi:Glu-tRNA(Gln) amidotransferase subunit E-like FAD-binding protein